MNSTQIIDSINAGIYAKNSSYVTPFSKGAYLEFVAQWKETYAKLSRYRRVKKLLRKKSLPDELRQKLEKEATFVLPSSLGFVKLEVKQWTDPVAFLLVLRKQMKQEVARCRQQSLAGQSQASPQPLN